MNRLYVAGKTDIGRIRNENQDNFKIELFENQAALAIVCDGMGGAVFGREASEIAAKAIYDRISASFRLDMGNNSLRNLLLTSVNAANSLVYKKSEVSSEKNGMGTTCVVAIVRDNICFIASAGDSRAYIIDNNGITQVTNDHTYVSMLLKQGKITKEEIKQHKMRNVITKAIGTERDVDVDYFEVDLKPESYVLLCSDGLTNYCSDELIHDYVTNKEINESAEDLIRYVNTHGGKDNITIAIIKN